LAIAIGGRTSYRSLIAIASIELWPNFTSVLFNVPIYSVLFYLTYSLDYSWTFYSVFNVCIIFMLITYVYSFLCILKLFPFSCRKIRNNEILIFIKFNMSWCFQTQFTWFIRYTQAHNSFFYCVLHILMNQKFMIFQCFILYIKHKIPNKKFKK